MVRAGLAGAGRRGVIVWLGRRLQRWETKQHFYCAGRLLMYISAPCACEGGSAFPRELNPGVAGLAWCVLLALVCPSYGFGALKGFAGLIGLVRERRSNAVNLLGFKSAATASVVSGLLDRFGLCVCV